MKIFLSNFLTTIFLINGVILSYAYGSDYKSIDAILDHYKKQIITLEDLDPDAREDFVNYERSKNPGFVRADFNGDGVEDVAILIKESYKVYLRFFMCKKRCTELKSIYTGVIDGTQFVIPVKKGKLIKETESIPNELEPSPVRLRNTAVRVVYFGKAHITFFWDTKMRDIVSITTGD